MLLNETIILECFPTLSWPNNEFDVKCVYSENCLPLTQNYVWFYRYNLLSNLLRNTQNYWKFTKCPKKNCLPLRCINSDVNCGANGRRWEEYWRNIFVERIWNATRRFNQSYSFIVLRCHITSAPWEVTQRYRRIQLKTFCLRPTARLFPAWKLQTNCVFCSLTK